MSFVLLKDFFLFLTFVLFRFVLTPHFVVTLSVTFFKAIVGAEDLFDQLADDGLEDINMEPLNTSDLVSSNGNNPESKMNFSRLTLKQ